MIGIWKTFHFMNFPVASRDDPHNVRYEHQKKTKDTCKPIFHSNFLLKVD